MIWKLDLQIVQVKQNWFYMQPVLTSAGQKALCIQRGIAFWKFMLLSQFLHIVFLAETIMCLDLFGFSEEKERRFLDFRVLVE